MNGPHHALSQPGISVAEFGGVLHDSHCVKTTILAFALFAATCFAERETSIANGLRDMDDAWHTIEPKLFAPNAPKSYDANTWVRCSGSPVSLRQPLIFKLPSGATVRLTKLQGADRDALASFRKPPSVITVYGPILAVDAITRTITIKAVSTMFSQ